jgi:glyoxylase-like metal-dependent hydrolase (beta-lactamase superfamily II)
MFPKAEYFCQQKEMEFAFTKKNSASYDFNKLNFLKNSSQLNYVNESGILSDDIQFEISGGHTPFHQVFYWNESNQKYFYGGDVLPQPNQIIRRFIAKYDFDGEKCAQLRTDWAQKAALEKMILLFFHDAKTPMAKVAIANNRFQITSA